MDTGTAAGPADGQGVAVDVVQQGLATIRDCMPATYAAVQAKAAAVGKVAYELVRRALRGEPGCFWAVEGGWVVGTPFHGHPVMSEVGKALVEFGCAYVCIWPDQPVSKGLPRAQTPAAVEGAAHGTA